jgi:chromosome transmission fidelity protein 1
LSSGTQALLAKLKGDNGASTEDLNPALTETKIVFCSRTHSQLSQFVQELRRFEPPPSIIPCNETTTDESPSQLEQEPVKHISLGSRKNLCINHRVSQLGSVSTINEKCLDIQKVGVPEAQKCSFLPKKDMLDLTESFRDHALSDIHDIEDLNKIGRSMKICPYYASRAGIEFAEILTLPYPLLLQKSARQALGVSIKDNVVIIDEAHNLMDAIADTYSCVISLRQMETATSQLMLYTQKFRNRLKGKNRMYVAQTIRLLSSISESLRSINGQTRESEAVITPAQLLGGKGVDQIQPQKLIDYLQQSKLAHKVEDYVTSSHEEVDESKNKGHDRGSLQLFQRFLAVFMNPSAEGQFFFCRDEHNRPQIRYLLLDPREHFRDIVEEARAVILVGGTMSPVSDYKDYLFSYLAPDRLRTFSFGHVVPASNLHVQTVSTGPSGLEFDFTFEKRKSEKMIAELGLLFIAVCKIIPDGVVAFFPSYDFLSHVLAVWKRVSLPNSSNLSTTLFSALNAVKPIFHESRPNPNPNPNDPQPSPTTTPSKDSLLSSYIRAIDQPTSTNDTTSNPGPPKGALLLSIISGTLSEGINFSDRLGRAILAIGIPFPNPHSAIWRAKLAHVETLHQQQQQQQQRTSSTNTNVSTDPITRGTTGSRNTSSTGTSTGTGASTSRTYFENTALRATNQAIGRVIRHRADYAAIVLVDRRWSEERVRGKLPGWIRESMSGGEGGGTGTGSTGGGASGLGMGKKKLDPGEEEEEEGWVRVEDGLRRFFEGKE